MNLLLDIGNSRIKWARCEANELILGEPIMRRNKKISHIISNLKSLWTDYATPKLILIANVSGDNIKIALEELIYNLWTDLDSTQVKFLVSSQEYAGVINSYSIPSNLGIDRWLGLIGAWKILSSACIIISSGTVITVDVLNNNGVHQGGVIFPGTIISTEAITKSTNINNNQLKLSQHNTPEKLLANDTYNAVIGGVNYALFSAIDNIIADILEEFGDKCKILITGGDGLSLSHMLEQVFNVIGSYKPELIFLGMQEFI